jgi:hypothetical protein
MKKMMMVVAGFVLAALVLPASAFAQDGKGRGKGDNKDDAKSGKVDRKGDGNSGQGDDLHKKRKGPTGDGKARRPERDGKAKRPESGDRAKRGKKEGG